MSQKRSRRPFALNLRKRNLCSVKANAFCELFTSYWRLVFFFKHEMGMPWLITAGSGFRLYSRHVRLRRLTVEIGSFSAPRAAPIDKLYRWFMRMGVKVVSVEKRDTPTRYYLFYVRVEYE